MASKIKDHIIEVAIKMFAERGYQGLTTRDLAKAAKVTEASVFRIFGSKQTIFKEAMATALKGALDPAQFLLLIYESETRQDRTASVTAAVMRWYSSLSPYAARLFYQAYFLDDWRERAYVSVNKIMEMLATTLERGGKRSKSDKTDYATASRLMIFALLQFKMTYAVSGSPKEETEFISGLVHQWLQTVI